MSGECEICGGNGLAIVDLIDGSRAVVRNAKNQVIEHRDEAIIVACSCPSGEHYLKGDSPAFSRYDPKRMSLSIQRRAQLMES